MLIGADRDLQHINTPNGTVHFRQVSLLSYVANDVWLG